MLLLLWDGVSPVISAGRDYDEPRHISFALLLAGDQQLSAVPVVTDTIQSVASEEQLSSVSTNIDNKASVASISENQCQKYSNRTFRQFID